MPIWIGRAESEAISIALEGAIWPRPLTHDLTKMLLEVGDVKVEYVLIDDEEQETFFARIALRKQNGELVGVDARPSDAIAIALRMRAPIYIVEQVMLTPPTKPLL